MPAALFFIGFFAFVFGLLCIFENNWIMVLVGVALVLSGTLLMGESLSQSISLNRIDYNERALELKEVCERSLPRDKECVIVITAKPE